jgi:Ala-tRNA(Pro) deacylase
MPTDDDDATHRWLVRLLDDHAADYRLITHAPIGATEVVSKLRGHSPSQAAKCLMLLVRVDKRTRRYVLAVVPGDRRVDLARVKEHYGGSYVSFCDAAKAEELARAVPGTVLPFVVDPQVDLLVDPDVLTQPRLFFNAALLDRSVSLATADYERIASPFVHPIAEPKERP